MNLILKKNILHLNKNNFQTVRSDGINNYFLSSKVFRRVSSYPFEDYHKLKKAIRYQGYITGIHKDKLSGNLNLLVDIGLKQDLIVLKETYNNHLRCFQIKM